MPTRPLSFCMVTTFYPPHHFGGDATYVHRLSNELARRGHRVTVVCSPDAFSTLGGSAGPSPFEHENVLVRPVEGRLGIASPLVTYLTGRPGLRARSLKRLLEGERFDVIHFHNVSLVGGPGVLSYGDAVKLYTTHEHWLVCPMHVLWRNDREPCEQPKCLRCTLAFHRPPQLWRYTSLLERQTRQVDLFLAPSEFTIRMHRERGFSRPMRHLPLFLPRAAQASPDAAPPGDSPRPYFLVVGRLEKLKGVQTLIELFSRYDAADLVVVGDGTHGTELRRQAKGLRQIRFLGSVPFTQLAPLYAGAIAVIAASVGYETFGMTVLEGFAQRTPAVVRELGALPELVEDSGGGLTFGTDAELLEALEALRTDPGLRAELGQRGYEAYVARWSEDPHLETYFGLIDEVLLSREAGSSTRSPVSADL